MKRLRRALPATLGTIVAVLCAYSAASVIRTVRAQAQGFIPFTLSQTVTETARNGTFIMVMTVGMRSDGSRTEVRDTVNGQSSGIRTVEDVRDGKRVVVDPKTSSKTTYVLPEKEWNRLRTPRGACSTQVHADRAKILGFDVVKVVYDDPPSIQGPKLHTEQWLAQSLNCIALRTSAQVSINGEIASKKETVVTSVQLGEADDRLFEIPASLVERAPSEVIAEAKRTAGHVPCESCKQRNVATLDKAYQAQQHR